MSNWPINAKTVLVLGGSGFVGRHAVAALREIGVRVVVGSRHPDRIGHKLLGPSAECERRQCKLELLGDETNWHDKIADVDAVLNCVGILRQVGASTYDRVHHLAPKALAAACAARGIRFVHVSALGLQDAARSRFITSKLAGEAAIKASAADWAIARPSLLDGVGGFGARWLRGVSRLPAFFTLAGVRGKIAALNVNDLGEALARLSIATRDELKLDESRYFDLGGEHAYEFHEYIRALRKTYTNKASLRVPVPNQLARLFAHIFDVIHFTPFSFGHWEILQRDNVPTRNRLRELLGRTPTDVP